MFGENQEVLTPRGKGRIVYIEDDFVAVELSNGAEMDFDISDISADVAEEAVEEKEFDWLETPDGKRVPTSTAVDIMSARADTILQERHDVLKGHLRQISGALGKKNATEIQKVLTYVDDQENISFPLNALKQDWKRELFLYALFLGSPPSTLSTLEKEEIKERYASEMASLLEVEAEL